MEFAKSIARGSPPILHPKRVWAGLTPHRIEVFTWLALLGKNNSREKLLKLNIIGVSEAICPLCNLHMKALTTSCFFALSHSKFGIGGYVYGPKMTFTYCFCEAFEQWRSHNKSPFLKKVWCVIFSIIICSIWKERNSGIFDGVVCSKSQIQDLILDPLCCWIKDGVFTSLTPLKKSSVSFFP